MTLPPAPANEDATDACCGVCGGLFHRTAEHAEGPLRGVAALTGGDVPAEEFPPGYDPGEADRLIGRDPRA